MTKINDEQNMQGNRTYKDSLFRLVFERKEDLLDLYNAMNLYEHQSTKNENMPLRGLIYITRQFEKYIARNKLNIYSTKMQKLPTPQYIVFYNGTAEEPDERIMKLSDAFIKGDGCLECKARLLNINCGHNRELMEKCRRLEEYAIFVETVRIYAKAEAVRLQDAITWAIDDCIEKGILVDILTEQRNEVLSMILSTFDKEVYEKDLKEEAYDEGYNKRFRDLVEKKIAKGKTTEQIADELEESTEVIKSIIDTL